MTTETAKAGATLAKAIEMLNDAQLEADADTEARIQRVIELLKLLESTPSVDALAELAKKIEARLATMKKLNASEFDPYSSEEERAFARGIKGAYEGILDEIRRLAPPKQAVRAEMKE